MSDLRADVPAAKLERIRALLIKAERTDNVHERETFMNAAMAQMARYGIEQAHIDACDPGRRRRPIRRAIHLPVAAWGRQRADLAWAVVEAMRCKAVIFTARARRPYRVEIIGFQSDVDRAELMFTSLLLQMADELMRVRTPAGENARTYRKQWIVGYRTQVVARIAERERRAEQEQEAATADASSASTALVLADRARRVQAAYREAFPEVRKGPKTKVRGSGYADGIAAGERADIGGAALQDRRRELVG